MTQVLVCDGCGQPIDPDALTYITGTVMTMKMADDGTLQQEGASRSFDFHVHHFPIDLAASDTGKIVPPKGPPDEPPAGPPDDTETPVEPTPEPSNPPSGNGGRANG